MPMTALYCISRRSYLFKGCCESSSLILNPSKNKEMIFDSKEIIDHIPVVIWACSIEQVNSNKHLGVKIDILLKWDSHVDYLCSKLTLETRL